MMFLNGITDTKGFLESKGITIWKGNTNRAYLDSHGFSDYAEGNMGLGYGFQWRNFGGVADVADYDARGRSIFRGGNFGGVDQISELIKGLWEDPNSRRHLVSAWNPMDLPAMVLPPCHMLQQYDLTRNKKDGSWRLDSLFFMRSSDLVYGLPFNMASYAFLNILFAKIVSMVSGLTIHPGNVTYIS